jgi:hypothetical protein
MESPGGKRHNVKLPRTLDNADVHAHLSVHILMNATVDLNATTPKADH